MQKPVLEALLTRLGVDWKEGNILIERAIGRTRNTIKVNGTQISLADLEKIAPYLADIHSQFDFEKILNPENYLGIIDGFSRELIATYQKAYSSALMTYKAKKAEYIALVEKERKLNESRDFYEYQYKELKAMDLKEGEEEEIASTLSLLRNYDKIYSLEEEAKEIIDGDFLDHYYDLNKVLAKLSSFQPQYQETQKVLDDRYYELVDTLQNIKKQFGRADYEPSKLEELEERENDIAALKRKYRKTFPELIAYRDELASILNEGASFKEAIAAKKKEMDEAFAVALNKGKELSLLRQRNAKSIERELEKSLSDLLLKAKFQILFLPVNVDNENCLLDSGIDVVDFLIETNVGEGLKSLSKVISGGEASRIMLAFKALFIKANQIPTVIFDEIDTGISGETAQAVARKIREISLSSQVIAITHMPQVASLSDHHILITKEIKGNRTFSHMKELNLEEKIKQVAYLISGDKITEKQLEYAKEMVLAKRD